MFKSIKRFLFCKNGAGVHVYRQRTLWHCHGEPYPTKLHPNPKRTRCCRSSAVAARWYAETSTKANKSQMLPHKHWSEIAPLQNPGLYKMACMT